MSDHLDRAAEVIAAQMHGLTTPSMCRGIARALEEAGMLVTPEHDAEVRADERAPGGVELAVRDLSPISDVARELATYDLTIIPVINEHRRLVGAVTIDDVLDHLLPEDWRAQEEAPRFEVVVVDNRSSRTPVPIVEEWRARGLDVRLVDAPRAQGTSYARNVGVASTTWG